MTIQVLRDEARAAPRWFADELRLIDRTLRCRFVPCRGGLDPRTGEPVHSDGCEPSPIQTRYLCDRWIIERSVPARNFPGFGADETVWLLEDVVEDETGGFMQISRLVLNYLAAGDIRKRFGSYAKMVAHVREQERQAKLKQRAQQDDRWDKEEEDIIWTLTPKISVPSQSMPGTELPIQGVYPCQDLMKSGSSVQAGGFSTTTSRTSRRKKTKT